MEFGRGGHPTTGLAYAVAVIKDELGVETAAEGCSRLEHLALNLAGSIPGALTAGGSVEATMRRPAVVAGLGGVLSSSRNSSISAVCRAVGKVIECSFRSKFCLPTLPPFEPFIRPKRCKHLGFLRRQAVHWDESRTDQNRHFATISASLDG